METTLYRQARERVDEDEQLSNYRDTILADWTEGDEHLTWVVTATTQEILDWAQAIPTECIYCHADVTTVTPPSVDDDAAWGTLAREHATDCEWVETRAHRVGM